jgi:hypothetical protein
LQEFSAMSSSNLRSTHHRAHVRMGVLASVLCAGLISACDDDDRPRYVSGVDADAPVSGLDDEDLPFAIVTSFDDEGCRNVLRDCVNTFDFPVQVSARAQSDQVCFENLQQCEATVGELEGCVNVNVDLALNILDRLSCNRAGDPAYRSMVQPMADLVNVCADVNDACNEFSNVQRPD